MNEPQADNTTPDGADRLRRQLVRDWQQPVYNLAYRLLGNEADAADATQEVFVHLLRKLDRYDASQPFGPWVYRVAAHRIRDLMRRQRSQAARDRRYREQQRLRPSTTPARDACVQAEIDRALDDHVASLDESARLPLVLHYYSGLTIAEVGEALGLPNSTVHSRIQSGLQKLRGSLSRLGLASLVPGGLTVVLIENAMRSSATLTVPAKTAAALSQLAMPSSGIGAALVGGSLMKVSTTGLVLIAAVSIFVGLGIGRVAFSGGETPQQEGTTEIVSLADTTQPLEKKIAALQEENAKLSDTLVQVRDERESLKARLAQAESTSAEAAEVVAEPEEASALNWEALTELLAKNVDLLRIENLADADLTEDEEASLDEMWKAWAAAGEAARNVTPYAFLDPEFLPEILSVVLGATLNLSDRQLASVSRDALGLLAANPPDADTTPLEAYGLRDELLDSLEPSLDRVLTPQQREEFLGLRKWVGRLLTGEQDIRILGLREDTAMRTRIRKAWRTAYGIERGQVEGIDDYVDGYVTKYRAILEKYGQVGDKHRDLTGEERGEMNRAVLALGLATESELLPYLTPEQREALPKKYPMLIKIRDDNSILVGSTGYAGF